MPDKQNSAQVSLHGSRYRLEYLFPDKVEAGMLPQATARVSGGERTVMSSLS